MTRNETNTTPSRKAEQLMNTKTLCRGLLTLTLIAGPLLSTKASGQVGLPVGGPQGAAPRAAKKAPVDPWSRLDTLIVRLEQRNGIDLALSRELKEVLLVTPGLLGEVPRLVRGGVSLETSDTLIFALEDIGSPSAQDHLVEIASDDRQRSMDRLRAIMALGAQAEPTPATLDSLWSTALLRVDRQTVDLSNTALLSLGIAGSALRHADSTEYAPLREGLVNTLLSANDPSVRAMSLKAIGNLHDASLGAEVAGFLYDDSAPVRASAAQSLGMLGAEAQRPLLTQLLVQEPRGAVRASIVEALGKLPPDTESVDTVIDRIRSERNHEARALMTTYLVRHLSEFEQARGVLEYLTFNDPTNRVRILASSVLRQR